MLNMNCIKHLKVVFFIVSLGFSFGLFAQTGSIKGRVFNIKNNDPLPFTNVIISGTTIGSVSDLDGIFTFTGSVEPQ